MAENPKITREDLESKFRALQADIQSRTAGKKESLMSTIAVAGVVLVVVSYLLGRRRGRKRAGRVEIRRF
jgi:ABC-type cobalt transport system substrate-binding protein